MRNIFIICVAFMLSACGEMPSKFIEGYNGPSYFDYKYADAVSNAKATVAVRASRLDKHPKMVAALIQACNQGLQVSVLVYTSGRGTTAPLQNTCVQVYLSDYPDLQFGSPVILADGIFLTVNGNWVATRNRDTHQEYLFQQQQKLVSLRLQ